MVKITLSNFTYMYGDILSSILTECVSGVAADKHGCIKIYKDNYLQTTLKAFRQQFEHFQQEQQQEQRTKKQINNNNNKTINHSSVELHDVDFKVP